MIILLSFFQTEALLFRSTIDLVLIWFCSVLQAVRKIKFNLVFHGAWKNRAAKSRMFDLLAHPLTNQKPCRCAEKWFPLHLKSRHETRLHPYVPRGRSQAAWRWFWGYPLSPFHSQWESGFSWYRPDEPPVSFLLILCALCVFASFALRHESFPCPEH